MSNPKRNHFIITKGALYGLIIAYVCTVVVAVVSIQYANYVDQRSNRQWCSIISTLDDTYQKQPPITNLGKRLALNFHELRKEFDC